MDDHRIAYRIANGYTLSIRQCLQRGFELFRLQMAASVANFLLLGLVSSVILVFALVIPFVPYIIVSVLVAGGYYACREVATGRPLGFGTFFAGFRRAEVMVGLLFAGLWQGVLMLLCGVPLLIGYGWLLWEVGQHGNSFPQTVDDLRGAVKPFLFLLAGLAGGFVLLLPLLYIAVSWVLAVPLVAFRGRSGWQSHEESRRLIHNRWWRVFALLLVLGFINALGMLVFSVGLLLTIPFTAFVAYATYEQIIGFEEDNPNEESNIMRHLVG